ncbi:acyl carrier protein [Umezawaea sp. Da 62-37]|uniref:acyl carrier protein n=1 Tax=Umezawaea sp. Da 62-37 TaxID=3075927 RepID=UPI0028F745E7|nr:acyl carrier protein [Umezawaea sp. Da 62-37]WNV88590.1 acyl carrier protein [Umezawaea sp. Da 62-37]
MTAPQFAATLDGNPRARTGEIVSEILRITPFGMTSTNLFKEEHDADGPGTVEILSAPERAFDIGIDRAEPTLVVDVDGVVAVAEEASTVN